MQVPYQAWVIVADGAKLLVLENIGDRHKLDLRVRSHAEQHSLPTRETGADRPGRYPGPGARRIAVQQTDWHALDERRFAEEVAERLDDWARKDCFQHGVLIAAPKTLGMIRRTLNPNTRQRFLTEIAADLTHHTIEAIERAVEKA